jgi:hypothetical protein
MVGRKNTVAKKLKKTSVGLGHTTLKPSARKDWVTRDQSPQNRKAVLDKRQTTRRASGRERLRNWGGTRPKHMTLRAPQN